MALFPLQPGIQPLGQFDIVNTEVASILGGEVMCFTTASTTNTSTETAAFDANDGYRYDVTATITNRVAATRLTDATTVPAFLADDGTIGYGTLFGQLIGANTGLATSVAGFTNLGPSTISGSGKVTLWDKPGLYEVSLDALAADFLSTLAVGAFAGYAPGRSLGVNASGRLSHSACSGAVAASGVASVIQFTSAGINPNGASGSLVTTPNRLVGATTVYNRLVVSFHAGLGVRTL